MEQLPISETQEPEIQQLPPNPLPYDEQLAETPIDVDSEFVVDDAPKLDDDTVEDSAEVQLMASAATGAQEHQLKAQGSVSLGIRTFGERVFADEAAMHKQLAEQAAARGDAFSVQEFLSTVQRMDKIQQANRLADYTKALSQRAAENVLISSPATMQNTPVEDVDKIAREHGLAYASEVLRGSREKKLWGKEVGAWEGAGTLVSVLGTLALASRAHPVLGTLVSAGTTAYSMWEHKVLRDGIKEITGIDINEKWGVSDTLEAANKHWASLPTNQALEEHRRLYDYILQRADKLPGFVGKSFASGLASRVHTGVESQPGWGLSNRTMDIIDGVAAVPDAVAITKLLHSPFTAAKSLETLAGGNAVGKTVAQDLVGKKDTFKVGGEQQVEWLLSSNIEQLFPDAVKGSAGAGQKLLKEETAKLAAKLDDQIRLNPNDEQLKTIRDLVSKHYSDNPNSVAVWNAETGEMWLQHPGRAAPFVSKENADALAAKMRAVDPDGEYVVKATNETSLARLGEGEFVEGWHWSNKKLGAIKPSTEGAYGPGAYLYLDELPAARGAAMEGGWSHLIKTGFKVDDTIDVSVPLAEQSTKVQNVAKKLNITDVKDFTKVDQDVLRNEGLIGIGNSKDDLVGRAQVNVFAPEKLPVELRKQYFMAEDDVIQAAIDAAAKGDRAPLKALEAKVEVLRKTLEQSGTARAHFNGGLNMLQSTLPDVGKVVPGAIKPMLSAVAKKSSDVGYSTIAQRLSDLYDQIGLSSIRVGITSENVLGAWQVKGGKEYIKFSSKAFGNETTLLHETAHAATANILDKVARNAYDDLALSDKQLAAAKSILSLASNRELASTLRSATKGTMEASYVEEMLRSPHEFLAYGLSERGIIHDTLNKFVMDGKPAIHKLFQWMADVLGLRTDSALAKLHSDFFTLTDELADVQRTAGLEDMAMFAKPKAPSHGYYVVRQPSAKLTHEQGDIDTYIPLGDPKHHASEKAMHERYITLGAEQKDKKAFAEFIEVTIAPLNRREFDKVDKVLREGDTLRMEFDDVMLAARGITSEKERTAYYAFRTLENIALRIKNTRAIQQLEREGWSQGVVKLAGNDVTVPVRIANLGEFAGKQAWDAKTGTWVNVDNSTPIIKTRRAIEVDGKKTTLFVKDSGNIIITSWKPQIPALPGSYRRIYKQDYFGRVKMLEEVDGVKTEKWVHLRTSNSGKDIEKWSKGMNTLLRQHKAMPGSVSLADIEKQVGKWENPDDVLKSIQNGEWDNYTEDAFNWKYNRSDEDHLNSLVEGTSDFAESDRLGRGMKLESIDKWNLDNTLSPMEALGSELSNVARIRNIGPWRDKWVDTWWNTFGNTVSKDFIAGRNPIAVMSDPNLNYSMYTGGDVAAKFAEKQRKYILAQIGTPTLEERWFKSAVESLTFGFSGDSKIGRGVVMAGHAMRHADPLQFARSFNFYTMLGAWNPAQLFVQTQAMVNIVAISPVHGMKAGFTMPLVRTALMSDREDVWRTVAKAYRGSADEFVDIVKALRKSGILDNIGATSMHNIEAGALNMFNGMFSRVLKTNTVFFNRAEEAVRITAFDAARREFIAANKGVDWTSDAALKNILSRTDDLTQNMTSANLAWYQRGIASIPGQFLQYQLKLAANLISSFAQKGSGRGYTRAEAMRIMGAHLMMYGLAGNGLVMFYDEISQGYENTTGKKLSDDQKLTLVEGVLAGFANEASQYVLGEDLRIGAGSRLGTFNWYQVIGESALNMGATKLQVLMGPSQTIPKKFGALSHLLGPVESGDFSWDNLSSAANATLKEVFSSWNNASKAVWAWNHDRKLVTNQGTVLAHMSNAQTIFTGLGMPPAEQYDYWRFMANKRQLDQAVKDFAKDYAKLEERETDALIRNGGKVDDTIVGYMQAKAAIMEGVDVGMRDLFESERLKYHRLKMDTSGVPALVIKRMELLNKGVKLKDTPATNTGLEE